MILRCTVCGYEITEAAFGDYCSRQARFDDEVVGLIEDRDCPECEAQGALAVIDRVNRLIAGSSLISTNEEA